MIQFLNLDGTPCAVVMMPIPRCQNPVMKWISREGGGEKVPPTDTLRETKRLPAGKGRGQTQKPARGRLARFVNAEHLFASSILAHSMKDCEYVTWEILNPMTSTFDRLMY